ncbi:MAG: hypothetical protein H6819_00810 [Phycisphaerales bacterium]|nr:hypothetical protein [Phycisphaerales bacterium]MCB9857252.1 hypothetical protein [Phycisphaerales bacterium]MCB9863034.1 hypothetical protein [Phycisphaerales bacterium]
MNRNQRIIRSMAFLAAAAAVLGTAIPSFAGPIFSAETSRISFQAMLTDGQGDPLPDGPVNLAFTIYHPVIGPIEGPIAVATNVSGGVVSVMVPVSRNSWDGGPREMGVSVNGGVEMMPRIPLVSVPHAFRVDRVENAELTNDVVLGETGDAGTLEVLRADGMVSVGADGQAGQLRTIAGTIATALLGNSFSGGGFMELYQGSGGIGLSLDGDQAVGTSGADAGGAIKGYNGQGVTTFTLTADDNGNSASLLTMRDHITTTVRLNAKGAGGGGGLTLLNDSGVETVQLDGDEDDAGELILYDANGVGTLHADGDDGVNGARLALGNSAREIFRFDAGTAGASVPGGPEMRVWNANDAEFFRLNAVGTNNGPDMFLRNASGGNVFSFVTDDGNSGRMTINDGASERVVIDSDNQDNGGRIQLRWNDSEAVRIDANGIDGGAYINLYDSGVAAVILTADDGNDGGNLTLKTADQVSLRADAADGNNSARLTLYQSGQTGVIIDAKKDGGIGSYMEMRDALGNARIVFDTDFAGNARIITEELQINGGSDLSEQFEIKSPAAIEPGSVVCIDPTNPGALIVSNRANDRTVAGIVSGAGGVRTGMMMGQSGSIADGRYPVALTGRVYCKVDMTKGEIQPGDLLTTSDKPGHCMKVSDHDAAQGAIIGKAMTSPKDGLVLVLVSLQ